MNKLKELRISNNLKQTDIAFELGIPLERYRSYENRTCRLNDEVLIKLSKFYNVSIDYLLNNDTTNKIVYSDKQKKGMQSYLKLEEPYLTMANTYLQNLLDDQEQLQARKNKLWNS